MATTQHADTLLESLEMIATKLGEILDTPALAAVLPDAHELEEAFRIVSETHQAVESRDDDDDAAND